MKTVGITGPRGAGKTTLWRAITGGTSHGDTGVVSVHDERLDRLAELHSSKKKVSVHVEFVDAHTPSRTDAAAFGRLREMDAIVVVVPVFDGGDPDESRRELREELILADIGPIENRLNRARKEPASAREAQTLERALKVLNSERFLRDERWDEPDLGPLSYLAPLTLKPIVFVQNVDEDALSTPGSDELMVCARLEAEVAELDEAAARELLAEFGVNRFAAELLPTRVFEMLDLITFFTVSDKEARAWELETGATASKAAGGIHSDLERGFIRAEVATFDEVIAAGSWDATRKRLEGKDYVLREGDVVRIRFSV